MRSWPGSPRPVPGEAFPERVQARAGVPGFGTGGLGGPGVAPERGPGAWGDGASGGGCDAASLEGRTTGRGSADMTDMKRAAIVTGGSRGIGAATARVLAGRGFPVAVNYRAEAEAAARVVREIEAGGGRAVPVQADVADPDEVARMFAQVDATLGRLGILVNNAGIYGPRCRFEDLEPADLRRVLDVNVIGVALCTREAIRRMSTRHGGQGGAIINVSSGAAYIGNPGEGVQYPISKGAVNSMTIGLSQELAGEGIRVNAVSPGLTVTDMPSPEKLAELGPRLPMGRPGTPEEIARAIAWLASDEASYVAGANLRVAGGRP